LIGDQRPNFPLYLESSNGKPADLSASPVSIYPENRTFTLCSHRAVPKKPPQLDGGHSALICRAAFFLRKTAAALRRVPRRFQGASPIPENGITQVGPMFSKAPNKR
jgi:hypothetical protein